MYLSRLAEKNTFVDLSEDFLPIITPKELLCTERVSLLEVLVGFVCLGFFCLFV